MGNHGVIDSQGLLAYGISTDPDPVMASPKQGNPSILTMVITVSNNSYSRVYSDKITFSFPIGSLAQDLTSQAGGFIVSANASDGWQISDLGEGQFRATPIKPENQEITKHGLSFQISNIDVNQEVGAFTFTIDESSSTDNKTFSVKTTTVPMNKFPPGFYLHDFEASWPAVRNREAVTLSWDGSDLAAYSLTYDEGMAPIDVTNVRSWPSPPLSQTTTFALQAKIQAHEQTVTTTRYLTVVVDNPDIRCTTLTATGTVAGVGMVPPGGIIMQSGSTANRFDHTGLGLAGTPYEGWAICNGQNATLDLRDRFIVGAGGRYDPGSMGGRTSVTLGIGELPSHKHDIHDPGHDHRCNWVMRDSSTDVDDDSLPVYARNGDVYRNTDRSYTGISVDYSGEGRAFDIIPPYFSLYYIVRL